MREKQETVSEELFNSYFNNSIRLNTKVTPNDSIEKVIYMSKNSNIATVNAEGIVTAINKGETEIIAFSVNDIKSVTKVIVK